MRFRLWVTFPEVPAGHACHEVVVEGGSSISRTSNAGGSGSGMIRFARLDTNDNARGSASRNGESQ